MQQVKRWALSLGILAFLWLIGFLWNIPIIENDLARKAVAALTAPGAPAQLLAEPPDLSERIRLHGRDLVLSGTNLDDVAYDQPQTRQANGSEASPTLAVLQSLDGVRRVIDERTPLPEAKPFTWQARKVGTGIALSGFRSSGEPRARLGAMMRINAPDIEIIDERKLARGAPAGAAGMVPFAMNQLARLQQGTLELSDGRLSIEGQARNPRAYADLQRDLAALPPGMSLDKISVPVPPVAPYAWGAAMRDGEVTIMGYVPDDDSRATLLGSARLLFPRARIADDTLMAAGAPPAFARETERALQQLARLEWGEIDLVGDRWHVIGSAPSEEVARGIRQAFAGGGNVRIEIGRPTWNVVIPMPDLPPIPPPPSLPPVPPAVQFSTQP